MKTSSPDPRAPLVDYCARYNVHHAGLQYPHRLTLTKRNARCTSCPTLHDEDGFKGSDTGVNEPEDALRSGHVHFGTLKTGDLAAVVSIVIALDSLSDLYRCCWV